MTHTTEKWYVGYDQEYDITVFMVTGEYQIKIIAEHIMDESTARLIASAPDMLEALEEVMGELDVEGLPCPLCGRNLTIGHRRNCIWHVVESAVRKASGEG